MILYLQQEVAGYSALRSALALTPTMAVVLLLPKPLSWLSSGRLCSCRCVGACLSLGDGLSAVLVACGSLVCAAGVRDPHSS
jgi:hypothetical protein